MADATTSRYNVLIILTTALGSFSYGLNSAIVSPLTGLPSFYTYFDLSTTGPRAAYSNQILGAMSGLYAGGGIVGCAVVAWLADKVGRKRAIQIICILILVGAVIQTASVHIGMYLVGRFVTGIGSGMINVVVPIYHSEVSPAHSRGRMVGLHPTGLVAGYAMSCWIGLGMYFATNPQLQWRLLLAFQLLAPLLLLATTPMIPESPRWLLGNGADAEALEILKKLHPSSKTGDNEIAKREFRQIQEQLILDARFDKSWRGILANPSARKRLLYGFFLQCVAQASGVLVLNNYSVILYSALGITGWVSLLLLAFYNTVAAIMNFVGSLLLDRFGRIKVIICSSTLAALMVAIYTVLVAEYAGTDNKAGNGAAVAFMFLFVTFFAGGTDVASYVYASEIFPNWLRAQGVAISVMALFMSTLVYTQAATTAFAEVGWRYYLVFIFVPLAGVTIIWAYFPETNGLALEEVGALFGDEVAVDERHLSKAALRALDIQSGSAVVIESVEQGTLEGESVEGSEKGKA